MTDTRYQARLTHIGLAKDTNSLTGGNGLEFKYFVVGDGGGAYLNQEDDSLPDLAQNSLRNEVWRGPVEDSRLVDRDNGIVEITGHIPPEIGNFTIREMGLIDQDGDLVVVTRTAVTERLNPELLQITEQPLNIAVKSVNPRDVTLVMDPTRVKASRAYVDGLIAEQALRTSTAMMVALTEQMHRFNNTIGA